MSRFESSKAPRPRVLLYEPRHRSARLPLSLLHVASGLDARVAIVDGRLEMAPVALVAELAKEAVCLGVSAATGPGLADALEVTRGAKAARPDLPVIWGGPHATLRPAECLGTGLVDACVLGAGERTLRDVVEALGAGGADASIPGMAFLRDQQVVESLPRAPEDVNHFPPLDYALLDLERHFRHRGARRAEVVTSRGGGFTGLPWCGLNASRVVELAQDLVERLRVAQVVFVDQGFFADAARAAAIARGLAPFADRMSWEASATLPDLQRALAALDGDELHASGARRITLFAEDAAEAARPSVEALLRAGLAVRVCLIVGRVRRDPSAMALAQGVARELLRLPGPVSVDLRLFEPWPGGDDAEAILSAAKGPSDLIGWASFEPDEFARRWLPAPLVGRVRRAGFYFAQASPGARRGLGPRLVHRLARARVRTGFYGLDVERRVTLGLRRARAALRLEHASLVED